MTPQAQNLAIAEACGWYDIYFFTSGNEWRGSHKDSPDGTWALPSYTTDLNAMHEAEKFSQPPHSVYVATLQSVCGPAGFNAVGWPCIHATASQRAEAFLRTIGKWQENPPCHAPEDGAR